jgi:hypothetical protein
MTSPLPSLPICSICHEPVELETGKTDEHGEAVHEDCYFLKLQNAPEGKLLRPSE